MGEALSVSFPYSAEEHAAAMAETRPNRFLRRWIQFWAATMTLASIAVTAIGIALSEKPVLETLANTGPLFALAAVWFAVPNLLQRFQRWSLVRRGAVENAAEVSVVSVDGFRGASHWTDPVPWYLVDRVEETRNFFLVYAAPDGPSYVPKSALQPNDLETFKRILGTAFASRNKQLRLQRAT